jgi:tripartite-type tricarboxylate transporter receptor subunit TctC
VKIARRRFLHLATGAAALTVPRLARAQSYPARPVHLINAFSAGGPGDIIARLIGQWLSERLGQPFVIVNRPGAGGAIGTESVLRSVPDGHTLLLTSSANLINASLYDKLNYNFIRDVAPVANLIRVPNVMVVNPSLPPKTVPEFIAYAKANPGKISMASGGNGAASHMSGELFKMMAGVDMVHVPYRGAGPALIDVVGGQVHVMFDQVISSIEHIRSRQVRALAVTTGARSAALPDLATVAEFVPGYEASTWFGIGTPRNTRAEIIGTLNKVINAGLADPSIKARLADMGGMVLPGSPADSESLIVGETDKWAKVVKFAGIKPA